MQPPPALLVSHQDCDHVKWDLINLSDKIECSFLFSCRQGCCRGELGSLLPVQPHQTGLHRLLVGTAGVWVLLRVEVDVWSDCHYRERREAGVTVTSQTEFAEL